MFVNRFDLSYSKRKNEISNEDTNVGDPEFTALLRRGGAAILAGAGRYQQMH